MLDPNSSFKRRLIVLLAGLLLFAGILLMPLPEGMTEQGKYLLATVGLMACWWIGEGVSIAVTALVPLVLFPTLGIMASRDVAPNYTNHLVFLFLGGMMIAFAMEKWNLHKRLALMIIMLIGHSMSRIVLGFMVASAFLSMWISNTATTMMMFPIGLAVVKQIAAQAKASSDDPRAESAIYESLGLVLMLGLAYSASIGGVGTLIGTGPNIVFAGVYRELFPENPEITFFQWMVMAVPVVLLFIPIVWVYLCRYAGPIPLHKIDFAFHEPDIIRQELESLGPVNRAEKIVGTAFVTAALLWIFRAPIPVGLFIIPGWSSLLPDSKMVHDSTVAMVMGIFLALCPLNFGEGMELHGRKEYFVLDWRTVEKRTPWGVLLLFGGGFSLAAGFTKTGLDHWIGGHLAGLAGLSLWLVVLLVCLGITFLTEMTSNTATATMILPVMGAAAVAAHYHPLLLMVPAALSASFAFMLPIATPPNAVVFGSEWVTVPKMSRAGFALNLIGAILVTALVLLIVQNLVV